MLGVVEICVCTVPRPFCQHTQCVCVCTVHGLLSTGIVCVSVYVCGCMFVYAITICLEFAWFQCALLLRVTCTLYALERGSRQEMAAALSPQESGPTQHRQKHQIFIKNTLKESSSTFNVPMYKMYQLLLLTVPIGGKFCIVI